MKAILEFNLPDDQWGFDLAVKASDLEHAIRDFSGELRRMRKYESDKWHQETLDAVHQAWLNCLIDLQGVIG